MNGVYKSLKGKVQDTFQVGKTNSVPVHAEKSANLSLTDEMEKLEGVVTERIARLKAAVKETAATTADEVSRAQRATASLKERIAALEAKLKETEETFSKKDSSRQQIEETLKAKVDELQSDLTKKEQMLAARGTEINELKAGFDDKAKQLSELTLASERATEEAAGQAKRADDLGAVSAAKIATLESQLSERDELARQKELTIKQFERKLADKTQDLESLARNKQELLAGRDAVISDLKSQLKLLTKGIGEMSSFFKQAQAFTVVERQDGTTVSRNSPIDAKAEKPMTQSSAVTAAHNLQEGKPTSIQSNGVGVTPAVNDEKPVTPSSNSAKTSANAQKERPDPLQSTLEVVTEEGKSAPALNGASIKPVGPEPAPEIASPELFERMSVALAEVSGVMAPLATIIVREHATALGESADNFPKSRLPELTNSLVREILDAKLQMDFRNRLAEAQII
jgi:hypothetical protein